MEVVKMFNNELSSLYETRPPISKAKMTTITRTAIKAIKFYKHVVQSVEKFIQKCKPEYKVPGLYVIDSIVRQSRHQFTAEKDVFAPRFARNITTTFQHLFNCPHDDKGKIVRVLNLWQKNQVFTPEVIQPLLDMASREQPVTNGVQPRPSVDGKGPDGSCWLGGGDSSGTPQPVIAPSSSSKIVSTAPGIDQLTPVKFDKKLLDFDYGEEEDEEASPQPTQPLPSLDSLTSILSNPEVLRQLQTLQAQMSSRNAQEEEKSRRLQEMRTQEEEFDKHLAQTLPNLPFASECDFKGGGGGNDVLGMQGMLPQPVAPPQATGQHIPAFRTVEEPPISVPQPVQHDYDERSRNDLMRGVGTPSSVGGTGGVVEVIDLIRMDSEGRESPPRRRRRSSRSPRRSARSPSRSKRRRSRSAERDYERDWGEGRKSREAEREKERERRRKGLPPIKKHHLAVCSTTLWIGHLSKLVQQEELSDTFGEYGDIVSINLIPPRGCAFVCMNRRQDAARALHQLKHYKLQGKAITLAWAPGKGMKDREWKDYWEVEQGVSYIPWSKLTHDTDFELLEEGGMLDPETFPDWLTADKMAAKRDKERMIVESGGGGGNINIGLEENSNNGGGELDIPMPGAHPLGYIPIPPPDPTPVSTTVTPIPPPMGIIPPFALPPSQYNPQYDSKRTIHFNHNVSLMGMGMGGLMGNVPLGVPPPLMMPQQMVPRMPASPFNPPLLLGGGEKGKGGLGPASGDSFPDHLAPLVNPFGLPVPLSVVDPRLRRMEVAVDMGEHPGGRSINLSPNQSLNVAAAAAAASGALLIHQNNKGPAEMDVDDPSESDTKPIPLLSSLVPSVNFSIGGESLLGPHPSEEIIKIKEEVKEEVVEECEGGEGGEDKTNEEGAEDMKIEVEHSGVERIKSEQETPPKRQRRWPRVNRWGDSSPPHQQPPPPIHDNSSRMMEGERGVSSGGSMMMAQDHPSHHYPPPMPPPNRPPPPMGVMGGAPYGKGMGDRDERDDDMMFMPRGFFPPRGPPRPPRPLLRTPNGPMFGPRAPPPGPLMPMRGPRPGRMDGMGFGGMRGRGRGRGFQRRWGGQEAPECA